MQELNANITELPVMQASLVSGAAAVERIAFTYYAAHPVTHNERVICSVSPGDLLTAAVSRPVVAELSDDEGNYIGAAVVGKSGVLFPKAIIDIVTAGGIYRITGEGLELGYSVEFLPLTVTREKDVIFQEKEISGAFVYGLAFELDKSYNVYWNGAIYTCTSFRSEGEVYTGNGHIINSSLPDTGEPFLFTNLAGAVNCMIHKATGQASKNVVKVAEYQATLPGEGLSAAEKTLLLALFKNADYSSDMSTTLDQLERLW
jgi:hypothetical protein